MKNIKISNILLILFFLTGCASSSNDLQKESELEKNLKKAEETDGSQAPDTVKDVTGEAEKAKKDKQITFTEEEYPENKNKEKKTAEKEETKPIVKKSDNKPYIPDFDEAVRLARKNRPEQAKPKKLNIKKSEESAELKFKDIKDIKPKEEPKVSFLAAIIYHSNGRADLSQKDLKALKQVVKYHKEKKGIVKVIGHASSRTRDMQVIDHKLTNFEMSYKRAEKLAKKLKTLGIPQEKIYLGAVSDQEPVKYESMPIYEAMNRRTEIYIAY
jgi:flagellar motor protein MotB